MIRGLYTAASGMLAMQRRQETLANNLANINTPGFKADEGVIRSFPEQLLSRINDQTGVSVQGWPTPPMQPVRIGRISTGVYMSEAISIFAQGDIEQTDNPLDLALTHNFSNPDFQTAVVNGKPVEPSIFYTVAKFATEQELNQPARDEQIRYTRNGSFSVNAQGYVVTADGYYVLDRNNRPIRLVNGTERIPVTDVRISERGEIFVRDPISANERYIPLAGLDPADPRPVRLGLRVVQNPYELVREGNNVYRFAGAQQPVDIEAAGQMQNFYAVRQGWMERSNVDPTRTMTDMMTVMRAYEANQRVITTIDDTLGKAANEIGRVNG